MTFQAKLNLADRQAAGFIQHELCQ